MKTDRLVLSILTSGVSPHQKHLKQKAERALPPNVHLPWIAHIRDHIAYLETQLQELNAQIMEKWRTQIERNRLESEIRAAELAQLLPQGSRTGAETGRISG